MQHIFINSFAYFKPSINLVQKSIKTEKHHSCNILNHQWIHIPGNYNVGNQQYHISQRKLMLSGDIELNPGPVQNNIPTRLSSNVGLEQRLKCFQLKPFDVGGDGDCFFRAVSHQLYGNPEQHLEVRAAGIAYMRDNPEKFIESNTEISWLEYLNNMSMQGTWAGAMIIQAVADQLKLKITIAETREGFSEYSIIQPVEPTQQLTDIYLGHIDEYHYVSTLPCSSISSLCCNELNSTRQLNTRRNGEKTVNPSISNRIRNEPVNPQQLTQISQSKQMKTQYMRQYMKRKRVNTTQSPESKEKKRQYMKEYRKQKREVYRKKKSPEVEPLQSLISKFHDIVSQGPLYICTCCDQLWYKHSVVPAASLKESNPDAQKRLLNRKSLNNVEWLCRTCNKHLKKNKVPPCAAINGMQFPEKPSFFYLNELECRLLAPRLAFQKLMQAPRGRQLKINGNIVNVPADVANTVNMLPRLPNETSTIKVNLKRKLQYKSSALSLNVRPNKVAEAGRWLVNNGDLYKDEGITFNDTWLEDNSNNLVFDDNCDDQISEGSENVDCNADKTQQTLTCDDDNNWSEDDAEIPAGITDTMLTSPDFLTDNECQHILNLAPGEGNRPTSIFRDRYSEELAYPGIFIGQKRPDNTNRLTKVHYSEICKSELRRSDRRAAMCVENLFFKTKKLQMKILLGQSQVALRKCQQNSRTITAGQLKQPGALDNMIHHDQGFKFLRAVRGSPPYFEKAKKDIFAMIRQLGPASLFCSFSSAETQWVHLLRILGKLLDNKEYTDNELENLNWEEKCRLIQNDPVTCARHFDYQVQKFLQNFLLTNSASLGKIADWFYRVEYQQRGSPHHIHMLIWLENAPTFGEDSDCDVVSFIDNIIMCEKPTENAELLALVNRQVHPHSHTCRKKSKSVCRFNYPQPPMRSTNILYPLDVDMDDNEQHEDTYKFIKKHLNDMKEGEDITFDQLLVKLKLTEQNYLLAIRSTLKAPTIFLKRKPNELRINNYNAACLSAWRANMDIQFVLDVYACAIYIVSYISKAQKGMSELLRTACEEARQGNASIKQQVRDVGNQFLNNVEISAQEAAYIVLQLPMRKSSRQVVFINTSPPGDRVQLLKPMQEINDMEDDSDEVYASGLIKRYTKRPAKLENLSLADWAAWYDACGKPYIKPSCQLDIDNYPLETNLDNNDDYEEKGSEKKNKKRAKARIIRSVCFNKDVHSEKHYRELIMLFTSWRNETTDLIKDCSSYQEHYLRLKNTIDEQMKQYAICSEDLASCADVVSGRGLT
jgi:hypothetical protein